MRYVVTGGAGFIGSHVVDELVRRKQHVLVLDDFSAGKIENLAAVRPQIEVARGDVCDARGVSEACRGADYVIHLAARTSVPRSMADPLDTNRVNVEGTLNVLHAARNAGVRRVIFASSCAVYGDAPESPTPESMPVAPISPYGASKIAGEVYGQTFHRTGGPEFVALRYFNVFGPKQDPGSPYSGVLSIFISAILNGVAPVIYGDGEQSRDFIHVGNIVDAVLLACSAPRAAGLAINVAGGERYTLNQTLDLLERLAGQPTHRTYTAARPGDIRLSHANISLAKEVLGYKVRLGFAEGLADTWEWFRSNRAAALRP